MKTYQSTLIRYFLTCTLMLAVTHVAMLLDPLADYRNSVKRLLGLEGNQLWLITGPICLVGLLTLSLRLRKQLAAPIQALSEQCSLGNVPSHSSQPHLRETRIIRNFVRQTQERADSRANQISQMESELFAHRKTGERKTRRIEELEDLLASYKRIRNELAYDNGNLIKENRRLNAKIEALGNQKEATPHHRLANKS